MATKTQTIQIKNHQSSRIHDYLYDKLYTLSSEKDHARARIRANTGASRVKREPIFKAMFSEMGHYPSFNLRLDATDPVPRFISRHWRGHHEQHRHELVQHARSNHEPSVTAPQAVFEDSDVTGRNRYRYFRRPNIPFIQQVPPDVVLWSTRQDPLLTDMVLLDEEDGGLTQPIRTVLTQTDFRETDSQTEPYSPEYVVRPGFAPELLTIATLSYGRGLPAGLAEVELIERARVKRAWEANLPPLSGDPCLLEKRKRMMDEMEVKEWGIRESEIEKLQEVRLEVVKRLLVRRDENHANLTSKKLDHIWSEKQKVKEQRMLKIRLEHLKNLRKLSAAANQNAEKRLQRRNMVADYDDVGSATYAPLTRLGMFLDGRSEQYVSKSRYLSTYQGLLELEASLPGHATALRIKAPKTTTTTKSGYTKRRHRHEMELIKVHEAIKADRSQVEQEEKPLRFLQQVEKPVPRPATPAVPAPDVKSEEEELAVILLQQLLRGRAIQNMMYEGKEKRLELIKELRSTHALQVEGQTAILKEVQWTLNLQRQRRLHEHRECLVDEALSRLEGESLGDMLDFLSKELRRLQEERRLHAFSMLAERRRRVREAEESGRRQVEERRRRERDEMFKQVVQVHQNTVDSYLEGIILATIDSSATDQASAEIMQKADQINELAYEIEESRSQLDSEEVVAELVHRFLLPEVQKCFVRERVRSRQRKYLQAAHKEILRQADDTFTVVSCKVDGAAHDSVVDTSPSGV